MEFFDLIVSGFSLVEIDSYWDLPALSNAYWKYKLHLSQSKKVFYRRLWLRREDKPGLRLDHRQRRWLS
jgi:hypothetical protein